MPPEAQMTNIQTNLFSDPLQVLVTENTRNDDWVNATKWCGYFGKRFNNFTRLKETKFFIENMLSKTGYSHLSNLIETVSGKDTFVHPLIAIKLAEWLSPDFDLFVKETFKRYLDGDITLADDIIQRSKSEKELEWLQQRLKGKITRKAFTNKLKNHGVTGIGYAMNTNAIYEPLFGKTAKEIKEEKGISQKETARDEMTDLELSALDLAEKVAMARIKKQNVTGNKGTAYQSRIASSNIKEAIKDVI